MAPEISRVLVLAALAIPTAAHANPVPTIVISVHEMSPMGSSSPASFALQNGGSAAKADGAGNIDVFASTLVRFVFATADYVPVGITFDQTTGNAADPTGTRNFPTRTVADRSLTVSAADLDSDGFEYSIIYKRVSDGALGLIDPRIINHSTN